MVIISEKRVTAPVVVFFLYPIAFAEIFFVHIVQIQVKIPLYLVATETRINSSGMDYLADTRLTKCTFRYFLSHKAEWKT